MEKNSWVRTVVTQISLCFALYLAFKVGQPQRALLDDGTTERSKPFYFYFISVAGDFRPLKEQTLLLRQMVEVTKVYKAQFVVSISELGADDPLSQNATSYFGSLKVPWYTTGSFNGQGAGHYLKHPYGKTLDIIFVNTQLFQTEYIVSPIDLNDLVVSRALQVKAREPRLSWLTNTLEGSISDWCIVVGFHPLLACNATTEAGDNSGPLHHMLLNHEVNAYLSGHACIEHVPEGTAEQLGDPSPKANAPCLTPVNEKLHWNKDKVDGFLLHRVSPLEFVTYLVNLNGEVVHSIELKQIGKEVM